MSEETNKNEPNNLSEQEQDERQEKFDKFTQIFDSFIYRVNEGLTDTYDDIRELAEKLEKVVPKFMISNEIKKRVKEIKEKIKEANKNKKEGEEKQQEILITDDMIEKALSSEYKEARKKKIKVAQTINGKTITEESTRHSGSTQTLNDDKKNTEQSTGTLKNPDSKRIEETSTTVNEPQSNTTNTTSETEYDEPPEIYEHIPEPPKNQFEILNNLVAEKDNQIKNLENQLKITRERKSINPKVNINLDQLVLDDGKVFDNTIYLHRENVMWLITQLTGYLKKFPTLDWIILNQDNELVGSIRLNLKKPQFITGNPH
jgi:hypothetical protein